MTSRADLSPLVAAALLAVIVAVPARAQGSSSAGGATADAAEVGQAGPAPGPEPHDGPPGVQLELLPELSFHLLGGRYEPNEEDMRWTTWIGAGIGVARLGTTTLYTTADVETVMGSERRAFDARQANYHLQAGLRHPVGAWQLELFYAHVSRHEVDREKGPAVDWNALGVRASRELDHLVGFPLRVGLSAGHTTLTSQVDYRFQGSVGLDAEPFRWNQGAAFVRGRVRVVTIGADPEIARGNFADASLEGGVRIDRGAQHFELFLAMDHRNDVRQLQAGLRNRALFGIRFFGGSAALVASHMSGLGPRTEVETAAPPAHLASSQPGPPTPTSGN